MAHEADIRSFARTKSPVVTFFASTLVGVTFITFAKLLGLNTWVSISVPIVIMLAYAAIHLLVPLLRLHNEQTGDNLYYMGFLYTLTSLAVSLYLFDAGGSIDEVVRNFGVAVSSTIVGIALRIGFNQMRRDPVDIERTLRHELSAMTRRVRSEMDNSALEFSNYRRVSSQMLNEGFGEIAEQAERNGEAVRKSIEALAHGATEAISKTSEGMSLSMVRMMETLGDFNTRNEKAMSDMASMMDNTVRGIENRMRGLGDAIDSAAGKYSSARSPEEVFRIEIAAVTDELKKITEAQAAASEAQLQQVGSHVGEMAAALKPLGQAAEAIPLLTERVSEGLKVSSETNGQLAELIRSVTQSNTEQAANRAAGRELESKVANLSTAVDAMAERSSAVLVSLDTATSSADAQRAAVTAALQTLAQQVVTSEGSSRDLAKSITDLSSRIDALPAAIVTANQPNGDEGQVRRGWFK